MAKGFSQVSGVDFKMIAVIVNEKGLLIYHLDVSQAFVQAPLKEEILNFRASPLWLW